MSQLNRFAAVASKIESYRGEMIELQRSLTGIPALSPDNEGRGEWEKMRFLRSQLELLGFDAIEEYNAPDERVPEKTRPNLVARIKGSVGKRTIWIMTHVDIVPPGERSLWKTDPYELEEEEGKLYGRGVEDNQQGMVASLFAVKGLKDLGITPVDNVGLVFVSDEETGSKLGIGYVLEKRDIFNIDDLILVPDAGSADGTMMEVAEKSILWIKFTTLGKQCHGSMPEQGINSHRAAAHLITRLDKLYEIYGKRDPVFDPPQSTFEPTKKENNVPNINTIPGEDIFFMDCRVLPEIDVDAAILTIRGICEEVEREFKVKISMEFPQREDAAPPTPVDSPVVKALDAAIRTVYAVEPKAMGIGGGTVAAYFRKAGYNAVVWGKQEESAHQPNEYCIVENLVGDAKVFAHIFLQS